MQTLPPSQILATIHSWKHHVLVLDAYLDFFQWPPQQPMTTMVRKMANAVAQL